MKSSVVVIGIGEIGSVMARGFLRSGRPVIPATRETDLNQLAKEVPKPKAVLVAVGENQLHPVLNTIPDNWKDDLILIQNELLPRDWEAHQLQPTVISVWFEKKKGQDVKVVIPSPIYGKHAQLLHDALATLEIPSVLLDNQNELLFELVRKNYYILTSNLAGLRVGGTVGQLWEKHREFACRVIDDVHAIQEYLVGKPLDKNKLIDAMVIAFKADPEHACMGRSAPDRLRRALAIADDAGLALPTLRELAAELENNH